MARKLPTPSTDLTWSIRAIADVGKLVRNQRAVNAMRIDDAAALCGVSPDVLSRLENGNSVNLDKLMAILDSLGLRMLVLPKRSAVELEPVLQDMQVGSSSPVKEPPSGNSGHGT